MTISGEGVTFSGGVRPVGLYQLSFGAPQTSGAPDLAEAAVSSAPVAVTPIWSGQASWKWWPELRLTGIEFKAALPEPLPKQHDETLQALARDWRALCASNDWDITLDEARGNILSRGVDFIAWEIYKNACDACEVVDTEGHPARGQVELRIYRRGTDLVLEALDCGPGIVQYHTRNGRFIVEQGPLPEDSPIKGRWSLHGVGLRWTKFLCEVYGGALEIQSPAVDGYMTSIRAVLPLCAVEQRKPDHEVADVHLHRPEQIVDQRDKEFD